MPNIDSKLYPTFVVQGKHVAEIAKPTKANHGKLGKYEEYYCILLSINVPSSNPPPPCYKPYIQRGVTGRIY